ncbi:hypothetical protein [Paracoccus binzhouensis]|uniref:hypothetical protein n=1 Tax=Paracoccus binzhouensis TaxID=2796149 RepID=UPI0018EEF70E|nr:hypothetical protein [Paracoccus binzhouensis]
MNDRLRQRIESLREKLRSEPAAPLIGDVPEGIARPNSGSAFWDEFLAISDGGRYGSVDLFANRNLSANQFWLEQFPLNAIVVGQILYRPLFLDLKSNHLLFAADESEPIDLGHADVVLETQFLGSGYEQLDSSFKEDEWWDLVR